MYRIWQSVKLLQAHYVYLFTSRKHTNVIAERDLTSIWIHKSGIIKKIMLENKFYSPSQTVPVVYFSPSCCCFGLCWCHGKLEQKMEQKKSLKRFLHKNISYSRGNTACCFIKEWKGFVVQRRILSPTNLTIKLYRSLGYNTPFSDYISLLPFCQQEKNSWILKSPPFF